MTATPTTALWRPVGKAELDVIEEYAAQIAGRWNTKGGQLGYVTRFEVRTDFLEAPTAA